MADKDFVGSKMRVLHKWRRGNFFHVVALTSATKGSELRLVGIAAVLIVD